MRYVLGRVLSLLFVTLGMSVVMFGISHALPGDPVKAALGEYASKEALDSYRQELGLDRPVPVQYAIWLGKVAQLDFGRSIISRRPVAADLAEALPATLELGIASLLLSCALAVPLGVLSAVRHDGAIDHLGRLATLFLMCMPIFWLGILLQIVFYQHLGALPPGARLESGVAPPAGPTGFYTLDGLIAGRPDVALDALKHLILPTIALSGANLAVIARMTRSSMLDVLREPYVAAARAKGLAERAVVYRHALKNAAVPVVTIVGLRVGQLIGGTVLVETIFDWPGIGRYAVNAIQYLDFPAMMAVAIVAVVGYALANLLVDLSYLWLDPRTAR